MGSIRGWIKRVESERDRVFFRIISRTISSGSKVVYILEMCDKRERRSEEIAFLITRFPVQVKMKLESQRWRSILNNGGLIVKPSTYLYSYFTKCLLRCSFTQTNFFAMFNVSVIKLWQCGRRQLFKRSCFTVPLRWVSVCARKLPTSYGAPFVKKMI